MPDYTLPFPGRELAEQELSYDPCYEKIPPEDRPKIVEAAWSKGEAAAKRIFEKFGGERDFRKIAENSGLKVCPKDTDYVVGRQRYFSDYLSGTNEYYHFLECNEIGLTSRDYSVPMLRLGRLKIGSTGIRALSEIGAHAFARTYYEQLQQEENGNERTTV